MENEEWRMEVEGQRSRVRGQTAVDRALFLSRGILAACKREARKSPNSTV